MSVSSPLLEKIIKTADDNKATSITVYDVAPESIIADEIVLMSVTNTVHCKSLAELLDRDISQFTRDRETKDYSHPRLSGSAESGWIILDANSVIIHIMTEDVREFYQLDQLLETRGTAYHH